MSFFKYLLSKFFNIIISSGIICTLLLGLSAKPAFAQFTPSINVQKPNVQKTVVEVRINAKVGRFRTDPISSTAFQTDILLTDGKPEGNFELEQLNEKRGVLGLELDRVVTGGKPVINLVNIENGKAVITVPKARQVLNNHCMYLGKAKITLFDGKFDGPSQGLPDSFNFEFTPDDLTPDSHPESCSSGALPGPIRRPIPINLTREVFPPNEIEISITSVTQCSKGGCVPFPPPIPGPPVPGPPDPLASSPVFDEDFYLMSYADLRKAFGTNRVSASKHWLKYGIKEGRRSSPAFDARYYLGKYPDLQKVFGADNYKGANEHWLNFGVAEGRQGSADFDPKFYLSNNPDVARAFGANNYKGAIEHWLSNGLAEGRQGSADFDPKFYLYNNPDVASGLSRLIL